jgi:hypothetical protein
MELKKDASLPKVEMGCALKWHKFPPGMKV